MPRRKNVVFAAEFDRYRNQMEEAEDREDEYDRHNRDEQPEEKLEEPPEEKSEEQSDEQSEASASSDHINDVTYIPSSTPSPIPLDYDSFDSQYDKKRRKRKRTKSALSDIIQADSKVLLDNNEADSSELSDIIFPPPKRKKTKSMVSESSDQSDINEADSSELSDIIFPPPKRKKTKSMVSESSVQSDINEADSSELSDIIFPPPTEVISLVNSDESSSDREVVPSDASRMNQIASNTRVSVPIVVSDSSDAPIIVSDSSDASNAPNAPSVSDGKRMAPNAPSVSDGKRMARKDSFNSYDPSRYTGKELGQHFRDEWLAVDEFYEKLKALRRTRPEHPMVRNDGFLPSSGGDMSDSQSSSRDMSDSKFDYGADSDGGSFHTQPEGISTPPTYPISDSSSNEDVNNANNVDLSFMDAVPTNEDDLVAARLARGERGANSDGSQSALDPRFVLSDSQGSDSDIILFNRYPGPSQSGEDSVRSNQSRSDGSQSGSDENSIGSNQSRSVDSQPEYDEFRREMDEISRMAHQPRYDYSLDSQGYYK
jgi:hypothetical protein